MPYKSRPSSGLSSLVEIRGVGCTRRSVGTLFGRSLNYRETTLLRNSWRDESDSEMRQLMVNLSHRGVRLVSSFLVNLQQPDHRIVPGSQENCRGPSSDPFTLTSVFVKLIAWNFLKHCGVLQMW